VRNRRLLTGTVSQRGSVAVETVFAVVFVMLLLVSVVEVAFALYARNILMASAHEGVRAVVERGAEDADASTIAREVVEQSVGGLVDSFRVGVRERISESRSEVTVTVLGRIRAFGPIPLPIEVTGQATAARDPLTQ
jgi:hypothetical protein